MFQNNVDLGAISVSDFPKLHFFRILAQYELCTRCTKILMHEWVHNILCCLNFKMSIYFFTEMQKLPTILQATTSSRLLLCQTHHKNQEVLDSSNLLLITVPVETTSHRVQPMLNQTEYWRILTTETPCLEWDRGM